MHANDHDTHDTDTTDTGNKITKIRIRPKLTRKRGVIVVEHEPMPPGTYLTWGTGADGRLTLVERRDEEE